MITPQSSLSVYVPLATAFSSGVFSLFVTLTTILVSGKLSRITEDRKSKQEKDRQILELFTEIIYQVPGLVHDIDRTDDQRDMSRADKIYYTLAKIKLVAEQDIAVEIEKTLIIYNEYADIHYRNKPVKIGNMTLISSANKPDIEAENECWRTLTGQMDALTRKLKNYLEAKGIA